MQCVNKRISSCVSNDVRAVGIFRKAVQAPVRSPENAWKKTLLSFYSNFPPLRLSNLGPSPWLLFHFSETEKQPCYIILYTWTLSLPAASCLLSASLKKLGYFPIRTKLNKCIYTVGTIFYLLCISNTACLQKIFVLSYR